MLSLIMVFGVAKAITNYGAGRLFFLASPNFQPVFTLRSLSGAPAPSIVAPTIAKGGSTCGFCERLRHRARSVAFHTTSSPNVRQVYAAATSGLAPATFQSWVPIVTDHGRHPNWSTDGTLVYHFSFRD